MNNELTTEQINIGLAKWHTEHDEKYEYAVWREYLNRVIIVGAYDLTDEPLPLYTDSLDTMRLIEGLMTDEQQQRAYVFCGLDYGDPYMATSQQRARSAFYVLGLEETNE